MKVALTVKNNSRLINPIENDVIIYDGEIWYVTTKDKLLEDANKLLAQTKAELEQIKRETAAFKRDVAQQLLQMSQLIETLYSK